MQNPIAHKPVASPWLSGTRLHVALALVAVYLIWGGTYLATKFAIMSIPTYLMIGSRFLTAGALLFVVLRLRGAPAPTLPQWRGAAALGVLLIFCGMGGTATSQMLGVSSSLAALGAASAPLWTAVLGGMTGRWPVRSEWLGLGLGFAGIVLLNLQGDMRANPAGALVLLLASLGWAIGTVSAPRLTLPTGLMASATEMMIGGALLLAVGLVRGEQLTQLPTPTSLVAYGYLIIFGSMIAFSAYGFLIRTVRPALATSTAYINPIVAVALGASLAGEQIGALGLVAMTIIIAGVAIVVVRRSST